MKIKDCITGERYTITSHLTSHSPDGSAETLGESKFSAVATDNYIEFPVFPRRQFIEASIPFAGGQRECWLSVDDDVFNFLFDRTTVEEQRSRT